MMRVKHKIEVVLCSKLYNGNQSTSGEKEKI